MVFSDVNQNKKPNDGDISKAAIGDEYDPYKILQGAQDMTRSFVELVSSGGQSYVSGSNSKQNAAVHGLIKDAEKMTRSFFDVIDVQCNVMKSVNCEQPKNMSQDKPMDWSKENARDNYSNFSFVIYDGFERQPYYVHKAVFLSGIGRSEYFASIFENEEGFSPKTVSNVEEFYMPKLAARVVPQWLDYTYSAKLRLGTNNVVGLRHVANFFDVRILYREVSSFLSIDLTIKNSIKYCLDANLVKDKELYKRARDICAKQFLNLDTEIIPSHILCDVVSSPKLDCPSEELSVLVAKHIRAGGSEITDEIFYFLTNAKAMPRISQHEALWYLFYGEKYFHEILEGEKSGVGNLSLKTRCLQVCSQFWESLLLDPLSQRQSLLFCETNRQGNITHNKDDESISNLEMYNGLPEKIKIELLEISLFNAMGRVKGGQEERE